MPNSPSVVLFTDPLFLRHETGRHPETSQRLVRVLASLERSGLVAMCRRGKFEPASVEAISRVHDVRVPILAKEVADRGGGYLDADTVVSPASYEVATAAAGACMAAVDAVMNPKPKRALCLIRPPGHHATPQQSMGFCLFNNIAIAAEHARVQHGLSRILIVDWDVHHGNGTQDIFYRDGGIGFLSIHRFGQGFYPGTGAADEIGEGPGKGRICNVALPNGISRTDYREAFKTAITRLADDLKPELVLLSAGFDAHAADPIGSLGLEADDFEDLTRFMIDVAATHASGRLVSCLEGGYNLDALAECVRIHLDEMLHFKTG